MTTTRQLTHITTEVLTRLAQLVDSGTIKVQIGKIFLLKRIVLRQGRTLIRWTKKTCAGQNWHGLSTRGRHRGERHREPTISRERKVDVERPVLSVTRSKRSFARPIGRFRALSLLAGGARTDAGDDY
ncbi:hypothetical protein PJI16_15985 [Nitrospira sp. MA-1]|nr:hypothetical protein [Nitrospira sp. MA-1]